MELYDAIFYRNSTKKFKFQKLNDNYLDQIDEICKDIRPLDQDLNIKANLIRRGHLIELTVGRGKIIKAPHYIVITSNLGENHLTNVGFIGEEVVLKITALGFGSCWVESKLKREQLFEFIDFDEENEEDDEKTKKEKMEHPIAIIALGYPDNEIGLFRKKEDKIDRKEIKDISKDISSKFENVIEAIRLTPSIKNLQPWIVYEKEDEILFYENRPKRKNRKDSKIGMGASIKHFEIACDKHHIPIEFTNEIEKRKLGKLFNRKIKLNKQE